MSTLEMQTGPVETLQSTPKQDEMAAQKLEASKAARAARKAGARVQAETPQMAMATVGELPQVTVEPQDESEALAPVSIEDGWPTDANGHPMSPKLLKLKQEQAAEAEAMVRIPEPEPVDLEAFEAFKLSMINCQKHLDSLLAEMAGLQGRIEDAAGAGDFAQLQVLRERRAALPWEVDAARFALAEARIPCLELKMAKHRAESIQAAAKAQEVTEVQKQALQQLHEAQSHAQDTRGAYQEARLAVGEAKRERGNLLMEMATQQAPQAHGAPRGMQQSGADLSGLAPMNSGGQRGY